MIDRARREIDDLDRRSVMCVSPLVYGTRTIASVFAMYSTFPTSAMPKGEFNESRKTERVSATPSPSASRSNVIRFALGTAAPAFF